ncbi:MAG: hypothetical protein LBF91_03325, partial [Azoarcus sp.]|nr:hypothetical protein [Azoarcus sp.]
NGFIAEEKYLGGKEMASLLFTLKDYPDISILISSEVLFVPEDLLIERHKKSNLEPWMREESVKKREFNGMPGSEVLLYGTKDGISTHYFKFESQGEVGNPLKPGIILQIKTGGPIAGEMVSTAFTTKQVRELYEKVLTSIRPRPTGDAAGPPPPDILFIETGK